MPTPCASRALNQTREFRHKGNSMIDLATFKKRSEFIEAWEEREKYIKHLENEVHHLNKHLQEYEGIQTEGAISIEVDKFLTEYGLKRNKKQVTGLWKRLSKNKKDKIWLALPKYKKEFPDKNFRLTPDKRLRHEKYNDEYESERVYERPTVGAKALNPMKAREKELEALREKSSKVNIKERLGLNK